MINGKVEPGAQQGPEHAGPTGAVTAPNGGFSLPGCHWLFGAGDAEGRVTGGYAVFCITGHHVPYGLHVTLTPAGLRHFAEQFERMATGLEEAAARDAAAVIAKAAGK